MVIEIAFQVRDRKYRIKEEVAEYVRRPPVLLFFFFLSEGKEQRASGGR